MGLINIGNDFRKLNDKRKASVGPLFGGDSFYLYQIVTAVQDHYEEQSKVMAKFGYTESHHAEFIELFREINQSLFKTYETGRSQPLCPETARAMHHNLRFIREYLEATQIAPLEDLLNEAAADYHLSLQAIPLRPDAQWAKSDEQERRRKTCEYTQTHLQGYRELIAQTLRIEKALESYCERHDVGCPINPLRTSAMK
mgnify:CR=1 FL=1